MRGWRKFWWKAAALLSRKRRDPEFDEEIAAHLKLLEEDYRRQGMTPRRARSAALRQFGNVTLLKEVRHAMTTFTAIRTILQDLRYGARLLRKDLGFTTVALMTLALGIGASTAVYSLVRAVLLESLPYRNAGRLVVPRTIFQRDSYNDRGSVSYADIIDWREKRDFFDAVSAFNSGSVSLTDGEDPERIHGLVVDERFFSIFGDPFVIGRGFTAAENLPGAGRQAVLSYGLWMRRFGGDNRALGRRIEVNGIPHEIIGVVRKDSTWPDDAEIFRPIGTGGTPDANMLRRDNHVYAAIARLRPGVSISQAQAWMTVAAARVARTETNRAGTGWKLHSLAGYIVPSGVKQAILALFGAALLVMLIACVNLASLVLARGATRMREIAVRGALGASRPRLVGQFLAESALLSAAGGAAGILLAVRFGSRVGTVCAG